MKPPLGFVAVRRFFLALAVAAGTVLVIQLAWTNVHQAPAGVQFLTLPPQEGKVQTPGNHCYDSLTLSSAVTLRDAIVNKSAPPLLTLFSTWTERKDRDLVRKLTLRNWQQLKPFVVPVLFTNSTSLRAEAVQWGWEVLPVSRTRVGVPVLKNMYMDVMARFNSTLYGYANGDILFTDSLLETLLAVLTSPALPCDSQTLLIMGRRTNVEFVTESESATFQRVSRVAERGELFGPYAQDYFITDRRYPWESIPDFVIGRIAYDNWLTAMSIISEDIFVVDATNTLLAVHQTTNAGNQEGFTHPDTNYNWDQVDKDQFNSYLRLNLDYVTCSLWKTDMTSEPRRVNVTTRRQQELDMSDCFIDRKFWRRVWKSLAIFVVCVLLVCCWLKRYSMKEWWNWSSKGHFACLE